jgi:hypothetical protein
MLYRRQSAFLVSFGLLLFSSSVWAADAGSFPDAGGSETSVPDAMTFPDAAPDSGEEDGGFPVADGGTPGAHLAVPCEFDVNLQCMYFQPLKFEKKYELPIAFDWDTGWIPGGSPLQVRFYVKVPAYTNIKMQGGVQTTWPPSLTTIVPGIRKTGFIDFDYGLEVGAKAKVDINILGQHFGWTGDIPYLPNIDFHVDGYGGFDPWAFDGVTAAGYTPSLQLFEIPITDLIIPIPGISGGIALNVQGELGVTYQTTRLVVSPSEPNITQEGASTVYPWKQGAWAEYYVHPEGIATYLGTLHLIPSFYIKILGATFNIPIYDFPFELELGSQDFIFDDELVHVPLPDLRPSQEPVKFGQVTVGDQKILDVEIPNIGEARGRMAASTTSSDFKVLTVNKEVDAGDKTAIKVRYQPKFPGFSSGFLKLETNDPDSPIINIKLEAEGTPERVTEYPDTPKPGEETPDSGTKGPGNQADPTIRSIDEQGGCGCRATAFSSYPSSYQLAWLSLAAIAFVRRRRTQLR